MDGRRSFLPPTAKCQAEGRHIQPWSDCRCIISSVDGKAPTDNNPPLLTNWWMIAILLFLRAKHQTEGRRVQSRSDCRCIVAFVDGKAPTNNNPPLLKNWLMVAVLLFRRRLSDKRKVVASNPVGNVDASLLPSTAKHRWIIIYRCWRINEWSPFFSSADG